MLQNCFINFAVDHQFGCWPTNPGFAWDIGAIQIWLVDLQEEAYSTALPGYEPTKSDLLSVFTDEDSLVKKSGLEPESLERLCYPRVSFRKYEGDWEAGT